MPGIRSAESMTVCAPLVFRRRDAAARVGVNERTAQDWDKGIRKMNNSRLYPDGRRIDDKTGMTSLVTAAPSLSRVKIEAQLHPRFVTLLERQQIADRYRAGESLRAIGRALGRALGRPASTIKREIDARSMNGVSRPHRPQRVWASSRARPKPAKLAQLPCRDRSGEGARGPRRAGRVSRTPHVSWCRQVPARV